MSSIDSVGQKGQAGNSEFGILNFIKCELIEFLPFALDDFNLRFLVQETVNVYFLLNV